LECHVSHMSLLVLPPPVRAGMDPQGQVSTQDLLAVRDCGNRVVENFRDRAIKANEGCLVRFVCKAGYRA
jgi:hypothetical protein